jgi:magnesium chelatase subunit D
LPAVLQDAALVNDSCLVCLLLAVDGQGLGGVVLDHPLHEVARQFTNALTTLLPDDAPQRRLPIGVSADRLIGGVDLAATLSVGRLVAERGVLAAADGGVVVVPMSERASVSVRTTLCEVLDRGVLHVARDGVGAHHDARIVAVLLDESVEDEGVHPALQDRLAFRLPLDAAALEPLVEMLSAPDGAPHRETTRERDALRAAVRDARHAVGAVTLDDIWVSALCSTAELFGVASVRATLAAIRCARAHAALSGRTAVSAQDAEVAARLVLAPRATRIPEPPPAEKQADTPPDAPPPEPPPPSDAADSESTPEPPKEGGELLRDAVTAALPPGLLAQLLERLNMGTMSGRVGAEQQNMLRGRPRGARSGAPRGGARLHLLETLRAAAPWQRVRKRLSSSVASSAASRVAVRKEDFRIRRFIEKTGTTVHFVVDASGSSAVYRLGEAKGAVELLLAESYARRDRVSLMAFRGSTTEILLPPTRALARAKRVLAALPGGGGTPMATAIDAAAQQALATRRGGSAPLVVVLSDGRANIARDGTPGRAGAERDAMASAKVFAQSGITAMFVDTSPRGEPMARKLADAMRARYVFLPTADAKALGGLVRTAMQLADTGKAST